MFWAMIYDGKPGPSLVWQKEWGGIGSVSYCERILPLVADFKRKMEEEGKAFVFVQDNAPGHKAKNTMEHLGRLGITTFKWPALSPDLNPIEHCWNWMKDYLQTKYGDQKFSSVQLRGKVLEAWDAAVTEEKLETLIGSMQQRCVDVIAAEGGSTHW
jgi:hypothetical protein